MGRQDLKSWGLTAKGQPKLHPLFSVFKLILDSESRKERKKREWNKEKRGNKLLKLRAKNNFSKWIIRTKEQDQRPAYLWWKQKESQRVRILRLRWCPTSQLGSQMSILISFFLTMKWTVLKLHSDSGRIKLVWLGLGRSYHVAQPDTTHRLSPAERTEGLESSCGIPIL